MKIELNKIFEKEQVEIMSEYCQCEKGILGKTRQPVQHNVSSTVLV